MKRIQHSGIVSIAVVLLLIAGVLLILTQSERLVGTRGYDTAQDMSSAAALALAESALQRATYKIKSDQEKGIFSGASCSALADSTTYSVGSGTFTIDTATPSPSGCTAGNCNACTVQVTGKVGNARRVLNETLNLATVAGTTGRGTTVTMVMQNNYSVPAIALFSLAWRRQGTNGNANGTSETATGTTLQWNLESSSGNPSAGSIGVSTPVPANTNSQTITQTLSYTRDYAEVGVFYPSTTAGAYPKVTNAYWSNQGSAQTVASNSTAVKTGFYKADTTTCTDASSNNPPSGNGQITQACQKWCYDSSSSLGTSDTLVFGVAARSSTVADQLTAVQFNGTYAMNRMVHYPLTNGSISSASGEIFSEQWYLYNAPYTSVDPTGNVGATSYDNAIYATTDGAKISFANGNSNTINPRSPSTSVGSEQLTGNVKVGGVLGQYCVGDTVTDGGTTGGHPDASFSTTIASFKIGSAPAVTSGCSTTSSTSSTTVSITVNPPAGTWLSSGSKISIMKIAARLSSLTVLDSTGELSTTSTYPITVTMRDSSGNVSSATINSYDSTLGSYGLSAALANPFTGWVGSGTGTSTTIKVKASSALPGTGTQTTPLYPYIQVVGGQGQFAAGTKVTATGTNSYTVSSAPTTGLLGAQVCGGVCGLFSQPGTSGSTTAFTVTKGGSTAQWAGGMICLSGVDQSKIIPISSSAVTNRSWSEQIQ